MLLAKFAVSLRAFVSEIAVSWSRSSSSRSSTGGRFPPPGGCPAAISWKAYHARCARAIMVELVKPYM